MEAWTPRPSRRVTAGGWFVLPACIDAGPNTQSAISADLRIDTARLGLQGGGGLDSDRECRILDPKTPRGARRA